MPDIGKGLSGDGNGHHQPETTPGGNGRSGVGPGRQPGTTSTHTRTAGIWAAVVVATIALIVLLIFILQNPQTVTVGFLGARAALPLGVALLLAAAIGGLLVALVAAARIIQLRRRNGRPRTH
ncbi:lipopolysaccharide assembly protein LapA domain-containing protein [Actinopolyspora mortivallis]|uniref:DUF1049 domain-containing protein n=1 Tax=Actinopolyspora mortivallis TaxID=33906 RepID=A0A2T0GUM6_ACTMO|nr:lipopolysaccharide assembly protein LapA domain-containing protein [Actinopolyspora mortivallis]PRW62802.1 DUF1049 domain-containing protein [Actinopolyspora mortivallis]